jgi:hypothetical protein
VGEEVTAVAFDNMFPSFETVVTDFALVVVLGEDAGGSGADTAEICISAIFTRRIFFRLFLIGDGV